MKLEEPSSPDSSSILLPPFWREDCKVVPLPSGPNQGMKSSRVFSKKWMWFLECVFFFNWNKEDDSHWRCFLEMDRTCTGNFVEETFSDAKNGTVFWIYFHVIKTPIKPVWLEWLGDYTSQSVFAIIISPYKGPVVNVTWNVTAKGCVARGSDDKKKTRPNF